MNENPYEILGVSENASRDEIDEAYKNLLKKYNPLYYIGGSLEQEAGKKLEKITHAYDAIINENNPQKASYVDGGVVESKNQSFTTARKLIEKKKYDDAKAHLDAVELEKRNAEWNYLYGLLLNATGFSEYAYTFFEKAYNKEPANPEFSAVFHRLNNQKQGVVNNEHNELDLPQGKLITFPSICSSCLCTGCCLSTYLPFCNCC